MLLKKIGHTEAILFTYAMSHMLRTKDAPAMFSITFILGATLPFARYLGEYRLSRERKFVRL